HAEAFARAFPHLVWQPTDLDPLALASISARVQQSGCANLLPPRALDVASSPWQVEQPEALVCINLLHISPWSSGRAVLCNAGQLLPEQARLIVYGPFTFDRLPTAESNRAFDRDLRRRNPQWGIRRAKDVETTAQTAGLEL